MAAHTIAEIRCDSCDDGESEWNVTLAWLRKLLKEERGWKCTSKGDFCERCAGKVK